MTEWHADRISCDVEFMRKMTIFFFENQPEFLCGENKLLNHEVDVRGSRLENALIFFPNKGMVTDMKLNHNFYTAYRHEDYIQYELHNPQGLFSIIRVFNTEETYLKYYKPKH